jgi:hypothetical protein
MSGVRESLYHLSKVDDVITFVFDLEWPVVSGISKVDEECRSIDLDIHLYERAYVLRRRQSGMDYTNVLHVDSGGPRVRKSQIHLSAVLRVPSGIEAWVRQSQKFLVTSPHEVHERLLSRSNTSASSTPVFPESNVGIKVVDKNESRIQGDHFSQLVLSESLRPRQTDVNLFHPLHARRNRQACIGGWSLQADDLLKSQARQC